MSEERQMLSEERRKASESQLNRLAGVVRGRDAALAELQQIKESLKAQPAVPETEKTVNGDGTEVAKIKARLHQAVIYYLGVPLNQQSSDWEALISALGIGVQEARNERDAGLAELHQLRKAESELCRLKEDLKAMGRLSKLAYSLVMGDTDPEDMMDYGEDATD